MSQRQSPLLATWGRWAVLPIAAPALGMLAAVFVGGLNWLGAKAAFGLLDWFVIPYWIPVTCGGAAGVAATWSACLIAPSSKRTAGIVMATILCAYSVGMGMANLSALGASRDALREALFAAGLFVGAIAGARLYREGR